MQDVKKKEIINLNIKKSSSSKKMEKCMRKNLCSIYGALKSFWSQKSNKKSQSTIAAAQHKQFLQDFHTALQIQIDHTNVNQQKPLSFFKRKRQRNGEIRVCRFCKVYEPRVGFVCTKKIQKDSKNCSKNSYN